MKILIIATSLVLATLGAHNADAKDRHHGGKHHYSSGHHGKHYRNHYRHYRHHNRYKNYYRRHHNSHGNYVLGGLVLGGILSHTFHNNSHHHGNTVVHTRVVEKPQTVIHHRYEYEDEPGTVVHQEENLPAVEIETRLLLDAEGRCFAITRNEEGKELLAQVDQAQCEP